MNRIWKTINIIGDIFLIVWPCIMIASGNASFDDYITLGGMLLFGGVDLAYKLVGRNHKS